LSAIEAGKSLKAEPRPAGPDEMGVLKLSAVTWGTFDPSENKTLPPDADVAGVPTVEQGDLLISRANTTELVGAVAIPVDSHPNLILSDKTLRLVVDPALGERRYLYYALRSPVARQHIESRATGTSGSMRNISQETIREIPVPLPPLSAQRRIAAILDEADALRRKRREALGLLDELLRSAFLEMFGDPVTNPRGWPVVRLDTAADIASGVTKRHKLNGRSTVTVPYMRVANVQDGHIRLDDVNGIEVLPEDVERYRLLPGDLLLTEGGDPDKLGRGAVWYGEIDPCIHQNHVFRVRCDTSKLLPEFGSTILGSDLGKRYFARSAKQTTGIASINMTQLRGAPVLMPPLSEQLRWETFVAAHRNQVAARHRQGDQADHLFNSLLQRAFTGRL